jgi:hypothetical protein
MLQLSFLIVFAIIISSCDTISQKNDKSKLTLLALAGGSSFSGGTSCADGTYGHLAINSAGKSGIDIGLGTCAWAHNFGSYTAFTINLNSNEVIVIYFPGNSTAEYTTHTVSGHEYISYMILSPSSLYTTGSEDPYLSTGYIKITSYGLTFVEGIFYGTVKNKLFTPNHYDFASGSFKAKLL